MTSFILGLIGMLLALGMFVGGLVLGIWLSGKGLLKRAAHPEMSESTEAQTADEIRADMLKQEAAAQKAFNEFLMGYTPDIAYGLDSIKQEDDSGGAG